MPKAKAVAADLDGTCCLTDWRNPYDAARCDEDPPNVPVIEAVRALVLAGYELVFVSGREDKYREPTERFLKKYFPEFSYELFMRKTGDLRKDYIVKEQIYRDQIEWKYNLLCVFDDRASVVAQWRSMGVPCFQVAPGDFDWREFVNHGKEYWKCNFVKGWASDQVLCMRDRGHTGKHGED